MNNSKEIAETIRKLRLEFQQLVGPLQSQLRLLQAADQDLHRQLGRYCGQNQSAIPPELYQLLEKVLNVRTGINNLTTEIGQVEHHFGELVEEEQRAVKQNHKAERER